MAKTLVDEMIAAAVSQLERSFKCDPDCSQRAAVAVLDLIELGVDAKAIRKDLEDVE